MNRKIKNISLFVLLSIYIIIYRSILLKNYLGNAEYITAAFIMIFTTIGIFLLGYRKDSKSTLKRNIYGVTFVVVGIIAFIMYISGLWVGYLKNAHSLSLSNILNNSLAPLLIIIFEELIRYVIVSTNKDDKKIPILVIILFFIFDCAISIKTFKITNLGEGFYLLFRDMSPLLLRNIVLTYFAYNIGVKGNIVYRMVTELYVYIMPIQPNLGEYIGVIIKVATPLILFMYSYSVIDQYENGVKHVFTKETFNPLQIPGYAICILVICLISGYFPHTIMSIVSNSMTPYFSRGDAVMIERSKEKNIDIGDVIAYKYDEKIIVHRITKIEEENGKKIYKTKGDANNSEDVTKIEYKDIKGKVLFKIKYIGYPTVWLSEAMSS